MVHIVVIQDWTIEIRLSEDGESVTIAAELQGGSQFQKTFNGKKRKPRRSTSLRRRKDSTPLKGEFKLLTSPRASKRRSSSVKEKGATKEDKDKDRQKEREKEREKEWEREKEREKDEKEQREKEKEPEWERVTSSEFEGDPELVDKKADDPPTNDTYPTDESNTVVDDIRHFVAGPVSPRAEKRSIILSATRLEKDKQHRITLANLEGSDFFKLPQEVQLHIFSFLSPSQLNVAQKVCTNFRALAKDDFIWKNIFLRCFGGPKKRGRTWRQESMSVLERVGRHTRKHQAELLLWGAKHGHTRFVENLLLNRRVNLNNVKRGNSAASPLHLASHEGHLKTVKLLLAYKAEVNARTTYGRTPLERAAKNGHQKVVELLLAHNADVNAATCGGETPLLVAASGNHKEIVKLLLAHGADVNATSQLGFTAMRIATLQGFTEIVNMLSASGQQGNGGGIHSPRSTHRQAASLQPNSL